MRPASSSEGGGRRRPSETSTLYIYIYIYIYIYTHIYIYIYIHIYIYIYIYRERYIDRCIYMYLHIYIYMDKDFTAEALAPDPCTPRGCSQLYVRGWARNVEWKNRAHLQSSDPCYEYTFWLSRNTCVLPRIWVALRCAWYDIGEML